jgi:hypothetical protein
MYRLLKDILGADFWQGPDPKGPSHPVRRERTTMVQQRDAAANQQAAVGPVVIVLNQQFGFDTVTSLPWTATCPQSCGTRHHDPAPHGSATLGSKTAAPPKRPRLG